MAQTTEQSARDVLKSMTDYGILTESRDGRKVFYTGHWEDFE